MYAQLLALNHFFVKPWAHVKAVEWQPSYKMRGPRLSASHQHGCRSLLQHEVVMWDQMLWATVSWAKRRKDYASKSNACIILLSSVLVQIRKPEHKQKGQLLLCTFLKPVMWVGRAGEGRTGHCSCLKAHLSLQLHQSLTEEDIVSPNRSPPLILFILDLLAALLQRHGH